VIPAPPQEPGKPPAPIDAAPAEAAPTSPATHDDNGTKEPVDGEAGMARSSGPSPGDPGPASPAKAESVTAAPADGAEKEPGDVPKDTVPAAAGTPDNGTVAPADGTEKEPGDVPKDTVPAAAGTPDNGATRSDTRKDDAAGVATAAGADGPGETSGDGGAAATPGAPGTPPPGKRRLLRRINPVRGVRRAGRGIASWSRRPAGRLILPAVIVVLLVGAAGTAGAYLVPEALRSAGSPGATPGFEAGGVAASASMPAGLPGGVAPVGASGVPTASSEAVQQPVAAGQRPADALAGWAQQIGTKVGIPVVAVQAYGYAELVLAKTTPSCHLSWTTIAAIAKVESNHGSYNGSVLGVDGEVQPPIYGLPLDGNGGRQLVRDTDQGTIDGDPTYDRAVGPLQFIPSTWLATKVDADNNGIADPNNINDASLTAAIYLCQGGRDMSRADAWWEAILSYNAVQPYAQKVFDAANDYGARS